MLAATGAEAVGLTQQNLGRQSRQAFYGEEAQRIQGGAATTSSSCPSRVSSDARPATSRTWDPHHRTARRVPFGEVAIVEPGLPSSVVTRPGTNQFAGREPQRPRPGVLAPGHSRHRRRVAQIGRQLVHGGLELVRKTRTCATPCSTAGSTPR